MSIKDRVALSARLDSAPVGRLCYLDLLGSRPHVPPAVCCLASPADRHSSYLTKLCLRGTIFSCLWITQKS
jgi:hypothetical protein